MGEVPARLSRARVTVHHTSPEGHPCASDEHLVLLTATHMTSVKGVGAAQRSTGRQVSPRGTEHCRGNTARYREKQCSWLMMELIQAKMPSSGMRAGSIPAQSAVEGSIPEYAVQGIRYIAPSLLGADPRIYSVRGKPDSRESLLLRLEKPLCQLRVLVSPYVALISGGPTEWLFTVCNK